MSKPRPPSHFRKDETGNRYGKLTVIEYAETRGKQKKAYWRCACDCGKETVASGPSMRQGRTTSCGCALLDFISALKKLPKEVKEDRLTKPRECAHCHTVRPADHFRSWDSHQCRACVTAHQRVYRSKNEMMILGHNLKSKYGITADEYYQRLQDQGGGCAICASAPLPQKRLHVDHDHALKMGDPNYIRGLLCDGCNKGLGQFNDDMWKLEQAASYLRSAKLKKEITS